MTTRLSRRDVLLNTAALAGGSIVLADPFSAFAAPSQNGEIDSALQTAVSAGNVPGVVAMAATRTSIVYEGAFGGSVARLSTDTIFRIASMVKLLTSVAALQLVERGKLSLDEPAARIDPALAKYLVLAGFDARGRAQLRSVRRPMTLRHLLSHTAGFSYPLWDPDVVRYLRLARQDKTLPHNALMFDPGTRWAYGRSLDWVGRLVEIASGERLDRYFENHIFGPLGMKDTAFSLTDSQRAREAILNVRKADGTLEPQPFEKPTPKQVFSGGGGIYSTAPDYLTLLQALLGGGSLRGTVILRPETAKMMATNQIGQLQAGILKTTNPVLSNDVDFFPGVRLRWGLGHMISLDAVENGRKPGSLTWAGLFNTYYWIDPASDIAGVCMMQLLPFADQGALNVYRRFERSLYRTLKPA